MKALPVFFLTVFSGVIVIVFLLLTSFCVESDSAVPTNPTAFQIVMDEIMADPNPPVMLPDYEYIELFNRSDKAVNLTGWELWIGSHKKILPETLIQPGEYRIVCENKADSLFTGYGKTIPVGSSLSILNTGQTLTLKTSSGEVVHSVSFTDEWYNSSSLAGGRSLEMIDPDNPCGGMDNWTASRNSRGGTPGSANSVTSSNPDQIQPQLLRASLPSDSSLMLYFSEPMDLSGLASVNSYSVNHNILHPSAVKPTEPDFSSTLLTFAIPFNPTFLYTVNVLSELTDCAGNALTGPLFANFAAPQTPSAFDVVINEVLFDAADNTSEFIELYNRSDKTIDLSSLTLSLAECRTGIIEKTISFAKSPYLLFPGHLVVITKQGRELHQNIYFSDRSVIIEQPAMFILPNEEGLIVLSDTAFQTIDEFHYNSSMHDALLRATQGVSLERVHPDNPSDDPENWHSASTTSGYSTPGLKNSQLITENPGFNVTLTPEVFSPDNDGIDDFAVLHLTLDEPGWKGSIMVFSSGGVRMKSLVTNSLFSTDETIVWDGMRSDNRLAEMGIYIFFGELYNPQGKVVSFKRVISLVKKI
jgi:hypothetical protein